MGEKAILPFPKERRRRRRRAVEELPLFPHEAHIRLRPDLTIIWCDDVYAAIHAQTPDDMIGRSLDNWIPVQDRFHLHSHLAEIARNDISSGFETQRLMPDGRVQWWRWTGRPERAVDGETIELHCIGHDVTASKVGEENTVFERCRAIAAETHLIDTIESIADGLMLIDAEMTFVTMNDRLRVFHPTAVNSARPSMPVAFLICQAAMAGEYGPLHQDVDTFVAGYMADLQACRNREQAFAGNRWALISHRPTPQGGRVGLWTDITALKQREVKAALARDQLQLQANSLQQLLTELQEAKTQAEQASRAKSQLLASMSHELRTPLNAVIGFAEIMDLKLFGPLGTSAYSDYVGDILKSSRHLLQLIESVLDMSRIEAGKLHLKIETIEPAALARDALIMLPSRTGQPMVINVTGAEACGDFQADRLAILQILVNLLSNAIKATPAEGHIDLVFRQAAKAVEIEINDTGLGLTATETDLILKPFGHIDHGLMPMTVKRGLGLGIPIAKSLAEAHGGSFIFDSIKGSGTSIRITIPQPPVPTIVPTFPST
ncbi:MAG: histidine kinase dimerization/phospho-acceptor domain-containing protein [Dongiaceae bacterium]